MPPFHIVAISGSLRKSSVNTGLLRLAAKSLPPGVTMEIIDCRLPLYDGDLEKEGVPAEVITFKSKVAAADAVLFGTPEYNFSIPGVLKNAIDWASRAPNAFAGKAAAVVSAGGGLGGSRAQYALRSIAPELQLLFVNKPEVALQAFAPGNVEWSTGDVVAAGVGAKLTELMTKLHELAMQLKK